MLGSSWRRGEIGGEIWVEKPDALAPISDTLTETGGSIEVVGGTVESENSGLERGILVFGWEETGGGHDAMVIDVEVVLGEGGGEGEGT